MVRACVCVQGALAKAQPPPRLVVYFELVRTSKDFMRTVSEVRTSIYMYIYIYIYTCTYKAYI